MILKKISVNSILSLTYILNTMNKRIQITGGLGFIGSHLCLYFLKKGQHVICIDNLSARQIGNIQEVEAYPEFGYMGIADKILFRKRAFWLYGELKNIAQIEYSRHRFFDHFIVSSLSAVGHNVSLKKNCH